jgi:transposase-like protein
VAKRNQVNVITIDDDRIKSHLDRVVRGSVEETLNALLDVEADRLCNAQRYERSEARRDTRAGHYERQLQTKAGEVKLRIPKLRMQTFETAIIERYRRAPTGRNVSRPVPAGDALQMPSVLAEISRWT